MTLLLFSVSAKTRLRETGFESIETDYLAANTTDLFFKKLHSQSRAGLLAGARLTVASLKPLVICELFTDKNRPVFGDHSFRFSMSSLTFVYPYFAAFDIDGI